MVIFEMNTVDTLVEKSIYDARLFEKLTDIIDDRIA